MGCFEGNMREQFFSALIKPTHDCNLNCKYCYDEPYRKLYKGKVMSMETLGEILNKVSSVRKKIRIIWHGGEPLYVGIDWYKKAQKVINAYYGLESKQSIQSNGFLLNEEWAEFLNKYNIDIGVSFDGPFQSTRGGDYKKLESILKNFNKAGGKFGVISVINASNYTHQIDLYEYFKQEFNIGVAFNQVFGSGGVSEYKLEMGAEDYVREFAKFYKYWIYDENGVDERTANSMTTQIAGNRDITCRFSDCRYAWLGFNPVGEIWPCDRYFPDKYKIGHINKFKDIQEMFLSESYYNYAKEVEERYENICSKCDYLNFCGGGCNATQVNANGDATGVDEVACESFKKQFDVVYDILRDVDIYSQPLNIEFKKILLEGPFFTLKEIKDALKRSGINKVFNYDRSNILKSEEYKLFRLFNPEKRPVFVLGHIDVEVPRVSASVNLNDKDAMMQVKDVRELALDRYIKSSYEKIMSLGGDK